MIADMLKIHLVVRQQDRESLLEVLSDLAVVHLSPVQPEQAVAEEKIVSRLDVLSRAIQIMSSLTPAQEKPQIDANEAVDEVLKLQRLNAERDSRLTSIYRQLEQQKLWGDTTLADMQQLSRAGVAPSFYRLMEEDLSSVNAECVAVLSPPTAGKCLAAIIDRSHSATIPETAEQISLPGQDNPALKREAAQLDQKRKQDNQRLCELAALLPEIEKQKKQLQQQASFSIASNGGLAQDCLFALQGWIPADNAPQLMPNLQKAGIDAALRSFKPEEEDAPPTLIRYPKWSLPIKGLFDILGTFPGYREIDLSGFFMIALPIFAAMLIGDAGYGLLFMLPPIIFYRKLSALAGKEKTLLLLVLGAVTLVWGVMTANYFGITPESMAYTGKFLQTVNGKEIPDYVALQAGSGLWASMGKVMIQLAPFWRADGDAARQLLIQISFLLGSLHLILAHVRKIIAYFPDSRMFAEAGWCLVLAAMLGIIWMLFFGAEQLPVGTSTLVVGLIVGLALAILFSVPAKNPAKRIALGLASSLLPAIGTFSDTMSYIRLMAVGLASYYIAVAFNSLGASVAESATWFAAAPIIVFGHLLNMALAVIAIFAHGVRLNMLEFSNNAGVQWVGFIYAPFAKQE